MADRITETKLTSAPELPEVLESVLRFMLNESREQLESGEGVIPRTGLVIGDKLFEEAAQADTVEGCYGLAQHTVRDASGARAYGFTYDGYIEIDNKTVDAIIAEGGVPGEETGHAIGLVYTANEDGTFEFEDKPTYVGMAPNFMHGLRVPRQDRKPEDEVVEAGEEGVAIEIDEVVESDGSVLVEETVVSETADGVVVEEIVETITAAESVEE